jgi:protein TonB
MAEGAYLGTRKSPTALTVVVLMHGAAITALALSRMDVMYVGPKPPIDIIDIKIPPPPPEIKPEPVKQQPQQRQVVTMPDRVVDPPIQRPVYDSSDIYEPAQPHIRPGPVDIILPPAPPPPPPPPPEAKKVEPARARANLASYVSDADYPAAALRSEEQGATRFRLAVGPDGRVRECAVTGSSGSSSLDAATCRIMKSRARFTPARDSTGSATGDTVSSTIRWVLPE